MRTEKIYTGAGDRFDQICKEAKDIATDISGLVEFEFNGVTCLVHEQTDLALLDRDYSYALNMQWPIVGPNCPAQWSQSIMQRIKAKEDEREAQRKAMQEEYEAENKAKEWFIEQSRRIRSGHLPIRRTLGQVDAALHRVR